MWKQKDAGYEQSITAYPVAASARAAKVHWQTQSTISHLKTGNDIIIDEFIDYFSQPASIERHIALAALLKSVSQNSKQQLANEILNTRPDIQSTLLIPLASELKNKALFTTAINNYQYHRKFQPFNIKELSRITQLFSIDEAEKILLLMSSKEGLETVAIQQMADIVDQSTVISEQLFNRLGERKFGGDAAMALSKTTDLLLLQKLESNLYNSPPLLQRRSILALELNASFTAKQMLTQFIKSPVNNQLKSEVSQWLDAS